MVDESDQQGVGQAFLVGPLGVTEDARQCRRVSPLDLTHRRVDPLPDVGGSLAQVGPVRPDGDLKAVLLWEVRVLGIAVRLLECLGAFFVVDIADPLQEQQREDVRLEIGCVNRAAQDVGGLPKHRFQRAGVVRHDLPG